MRRTVEVAVKVDGRRRKMRLPVFKVLLSDGGTKHAKGRRGLPRTIWAKRLPRGRRPGSVVRATGSGRLRLCGVGLHLTTNPWKWLKRADDRVFLAAYDPKQTVGIPKLGKEEKNKFCVRRARLLREVSRPHADRLSKRKIRGFAST
jgi:hypothetical protein